MKRFSDILDAVSQNPIKKIAIASAGDRTVIQAAKKAQDAGVAQVVLVGDEGTIKTLAEEAGLALDEKAVVHEPAPEKAAFRAAEIVSTGGADVLMKGYIHTDDFLRGVLDRQVGLRAGTRMSHVFVCQLQAFDRFIMVTDAAMNIAPDLVTKAEIIMNGVHMSRILGIEKPKVACLAAIELLNPKMQATIDATCLETMSARGQFSPGCLVDGPFALDNALSPAAAAHKKIGGPVAGQADLLVVPMIEAGNMLVKSFVYGAGALTAGCVVGARAPVVLTSRADSSESKFLSMALAVLMCDVERSLRLKIGKVHY